MSEFEIELLKKLDIIISTVIHSKDWIYNIMSSILGVIVGSLLTLFISKSGKMKVNIVSYKKHLQKNVDGEEKEVTDYNEAHSLVIELVVDYYNSKPVSFGIVNICIRFELKDKHITKNKNEHVFRLIDSEKKKYSDYELISKPEELINIEPNKITRKKYEVILDDRDRRYFTNNWNISFEYNDTNNKFYSIRLEKENR